MPTDNDTIVIRELAKQVAEIAALPIQEETKRLWRKLNALKPERPMVMIDQVCWNEINVNDELTLRCEDGKYSGYEWQLGRTLFQWKHFPVDMVVEPFIRVPKAIRNTGFGICAHDERAVTDPTNHIVGHQYENQLANDSDLEKITSPIITHDQEETDRRLSVAHDLFDGILDIVPWGADPYVGLWDPIATWMGGENALYAVIDRPEFMHQVCSKMTEGYLSMLDQLEEQGLLCGPQSLIHCTGAYTDELPAAGYDPKKVRTKDLWMFGLAQIFSSVSPAMFQEFEVEYSKRVCERFGLVYYGCCDPLDRKMSEVRQLPNVRKISMSPWVNEDRGASEIGTDYVYSRKPNPALLAATSFDEGSIRKHLSNTKGACDKHGCPLEYILKDLSTVCYEPQRLFDWARIAMDVAKG